MELDIFPKVYPVGKNRKITIETDGAKDVKVRIQGMEAYTVPHKTFKINEDDRYPFLRAKKENGASFSVSCDLLSEQKYRVTVVADGEEYSFDIYALNKDLYFLKGLKGDTHLHTNMSDGEGTPFTVGINYRRKGYDFIAITDHHKLKPSLIAQEEFSALTKDFFVFRGEEVHNHSMGYFHVINFNGEKSVNDIIDGTPEVFEKEVGKIEKSLDAPNCTNKRALAYRIFISEKIREFGGVSVLAHPFWDAYGEYNAETEDVKYLLKGGYFDAVEVFAGNDHNFNGDNLMSALFSDLKAEGVKVGFVGCADAHSETDASLFNKVFTVAFAKDFSDVPNAIKEGRTVAVQYRGEGDFWVFGSFRLVKYARFLLSEYFTRYEKLCVKHADALLLKDKEQISVAEDKIREFKKRFFA